MDSMEQVKKREKRRPAKEIRVPKERVFSTRRAPDGGV
jgi:hypothetical protein